MTHAETVTRIGDWMRFWAPEVGRRIDRGEALFAEVRDAYEAVRRAPEDELLATACWVRMAEAHGVLDEAGPGAYDWLSGLSSCTRYVR